MGDDSQAKTHQHAGPVGRLAMARAGGGSTPVHRGRGKGGTIPITIRLTPEELDRLRVAAEANCRSRTGQALWFVIEGIRLGGPEI